MNLRAIIIAILIVGSIPKAFATAQYPDKIIFMGKEYNLQTNPLEIFFKINPDKRPKNEIMSSALWRGYIATFEITENDLYIKDIEVQTSEKDKDGKYIWKDVIQNIFPEKSQRKLDWYNGLLILPYGNLINYVHLDYGSTFENYILLNFKIGRIANNRKLTGKEFITFKEQKFSIYKTTQEYQDEKAKLLNDGWEQENIDNFLSSFIESYISFGEN